MGRLVMASCDQVAEIQGMYGPLSIAERVIQKIWLHSEYDASAIKTSSGKLVEVIFPGEWRPSEGPDFKAAKLRIDGTALEGDVEIHFYAKDWIAHGHESDPAYANVILHVVLYGSQADAERVRTYSGNVPEMLVLLPALNQDLEAYAYEDELLESREVDTPLWVSQLLDYPERKRSELFFKEGILRWDEKVSRYRQLLDGRGWLPVLHAGFLEVLGYRKNRQIMRCVANEYELTEWLAGKCHADAIHERYSEQWSVVAVRPANYPLTRLRQYEQLSRALPDWPWRLERFLTQLAKPPGTSVSTSSFRREAKLKALRQELGGPILCDTISGTRLDTLMIDLLLPLAAAAGYADGFEYWFHWYAGDLPKWVPASLKECGCLPMANGPAQAMISLFMKDGKLPVP